MSKTLLICGLLLVATGLGGCIHPTGGALSYRDGPLPDRDIAMDWAKLDADDLVEVVPPLGGGVNPYVTLRLAQNDMRRWASDPVAPSAERILAVDEDAIRERRAAAHRMFDDHDLVAAAPSRSGQVVNE